MSTPATPSVTKGICPKCGVNPAPRRTNRGPWPICAECREAQRLKFVQRQREKRQSGEWDSHHDQDGVRYDKPAVERQYTCAYCGNLFTSGRTRFKVPVCEAPECRNAHWARDAQKILDRVKTAYAKDPLTIARRRLGYWLKARGLSLEWYDTQEKRCGICGTDEPGGAHGRGRGNWCIDHDHSCCPYLGGCAKCIRGLLCHPCNQGLGLFKDDPKRLLGAIAWVEKHRAKNAA
jgi:hypothetical protein